MKTALLTYKGYEIRYEPESYLPVGFAWCVTHTDYDGGYYESDGSLSPESDPRHTRCGTVAEAIEWVDMMEEK